MSPSPALEERELATQEASSKPMIANSQTLATQIHELAAIAAAASEFSQCADPEELTREAVEFARETLGIERVGLHLVESTEPNIVMRGTWGTNDFGCTTCERELAHTCTREDYESLLTLNQRGELWEYHALTPHGAERRRQPSTREDREWLVVTPLTTGHELLGVFYNDTAISKAPLDCTKQANLAVFAMVLGALARDRLVRFPVARSSPPVPRISRFMQKVLSDLDAEPQLSGVQLARRFGVSPGHLARTFKAEVGTSLVDYRNRLRLDRFFVAMQTGPSNLNEAALQAGFGSYAQFRRVHWQIMGGAPSEHLSHDCGNDT